MSREDVCAYVDADGPCKYTRGNHWYVDGWHAFAEPIRAEAPQGDTRCSDPTECADGKCARHLYAAAQPETGDEADEEAGHHPVVNAIWDKYNKLYDGHMTFRALFEAYDAGRASENEACEKLRAMVNEQRRQLSILQEAQRERNRQLDAMHWVWCDGGCKGGVHRWEPTELTEELVALAERNAARLRSWIGNKDFKAVFAEARAKGESFETALASARDAIAARRGGGR